VIARRADYALATLSGVLLALSFPSFGIPTLAWIALAPLLVVLDTKSLPRAFALGLTTGLVYFTGTLYWITHVMNSYGGLQLWSAVLINGALIAYLALFPALFAVIVHRAIVTNGPRALFFVPCVWVATELGRTYLFTGFPWVLLGYSQTSVLPVAQFASVLGVYGLSGLVASASAAATYALGSLRRNDFRPVRQRLLPLAGVLIAIVVVSGWGARRLSRNELTRSGERIRIGLIQGNVDQGEKWNAARAQAIFGDYLRMTREAITQGAQAVLWPESSTPFFFEEDKPHAEQVRSLARSARVPILFGSDQIERGATTRFFNAAFLVQPDGTTGAVYRKLHLVPFGEYVPLKKLLFFAAPLVEAVSDFSPGLDLTLLPIAGHQVSTAICYEVVYPDLVRRFVRNGSELLTTITNDAWFGHTSAPYQHFAQASMRAIENGRYLVRAANTGISGIVDPYGRVVAESRIFEPAVIVGEARFLRSATIYTRIGDVFAYASTVATLALLAVSRRRVQ
jgi:apolipoprotein N-acyltransferase